MKLDIRRRMRLVALSGGVLSFVGLLLIVCIGIFLAGEKVTERRRILGESASGFVSTFAGEQTRRRLSDHVADKAQLVERVNTVAQEVFSAHRCFSIG